MSWVGLSWVSLVEIKCWTIILKRVKSNKCLKTSFVYSLEKLLREINR